MSIKCWLVNRNAGLLFILLLAFYMAFIPHIGYPYPLHVDEWMHLTYSGTIANTGSITFPDPFNGQTDVQVGDNLWLGFHIFWAMFQQVSGIGWMELFRYFPSIIFMMTVLAVFVLADREGFGWEAAFFTCLIPTTGGLLGPAFMVPMALGLLFIPLSMFLAFNIKAWPTYLAIFLITCFLVLAHATTAIILCIILAPYALISLKDNARHSAGILAALLIPIVLPFSWIFSEIMKSAGQLLVPQHMSPFVQLPDLLWKYGFLPLVFGFVGAVVFIVKGGKNNFGLVLGLALLLAVMLVFIRLHFGSSALYERGLTTMLLLLSVLAGAGLFWARHLKLPRHFLVKHKSILFSYSNSLLCALLVVIILAVAIPVRLSAVFYHMIDDKDYSAFMWIKDQVAAEYNTALVDPWKATAFTAITGKNIVRRIWFNQESGDDAIYSFLESGCRDTTFMRDNKTSFVYNVLQCDNHDLIEVRDHVFLTSPNLSARFASENGLQNAGFEAVYGNPHVFWDQWSQNCNPSFLFPETGRNGGWCVGIDIFNTIPLKPLAAAIWSQDVPVQTGKSYLIGGWIKTESIQGKGGAMIVSHWKGPGNVWISATEFMPYIQGTNGWTYYEGKVTAPAGATKCSVCCLMAECSGRAWYDDILFREESSSRLQGDYLVKL